MEENAALQTDLLVLNLRDPLQYSCLESPMDRGAWQAPGHGVTKNQMSDKKRNTCLNKIHIIRVHRREVFNLNSKRGHRQEILFQGKNYGKF